MNEALVQSERERQGGTAEAARTPPPGGDANWTVLWHAGGRALLVSEAGHLMVCPHPLTPFVA